MPPRRPGRASTRARPTSSARAPASRSSTATPRSTRAIPRQPSPCRWHMRATGTRAARTSAKAHRSVKDPVCGMDVDPDTAAGSFDFEGQTYSFCSKGCLEKFRADPARYLSRRSRGHDPRARGGDAPERDALHLPDAPGDRPGGPGELPEVRHGARAARPHGRRRAEPRTHRHDPSVLGLRRPDRPAARARDGGDGARSAAVLRAGAPLGPARTRDPRRPLGREAVLRARLGLARLPQPQHVHPDRDRDRDGVPLQRRRDALPGPHPALLPRPRGDGAGVLRGGRGDHHPGAPRPGARTPCAEPDQSAPSRPSSASRPRRPGGSARAATRRTCRSSTCTSAIASASAPGRRSPSTAPSSKARAPSTSRWSPGSPSPSRKGPGTSSSAAP